MRGAKNQISKLGLVAIMCAVTACSGDGRDGRELREAGPGQGESIAIVATTIEPAQDSSVDSAIDSSLQNIFSVSGTWLASGALDPRHTCRGANISPALTINYVPAPAKSLAITLIDLVNLQQPLWVVANLDPTQVLIKEGGLTAGATAGAIVGAAFNGDKIIDGYSGPCVTDSEIHEFLLVVYALDQNLEFVPEPRSLASSQLLVQAIQSAAFDSAETRFFVQNP